VVEAVGALVGEDHEVRVVLGPQLLELCQDGGLLGVGEDVRVVPELRGVGIRVLLKGARVRRVPVGESPAGIVVRVS
jgi:hypothetical protein